MTAVFSAKNLVKQAVMHSRNAGFEFTASVKHDLLGNPGNLASNKPPLPAKRRALTFHMDGTLTGVERSLILEKQSITAKMSFNKFACIRTSLYLRCLKSPLLFASAWRSSLAY